MCTFLHKDSYRHTAKLISKNKPVIAYKVLRKDRLGRLVSPFYDNHVWKLGEVSYSSRPAHILETLRHVASNLPIDNITINEGFHCLTSRKAARLYQKRLQSGGYSLCPFKVYQVEIQPKHIVITGRSSADKQEIDCVVATEVKLIKPMR